MCSSVHNFKFIYSNAVEPTVAKRNSLNRLQVRSGCVHSFSLGVVPLL